nr:hypothetical protein CFP56_04132 [Quercus suber]
MVDLERTLDIALHDRRSCYSQTQPGNRISGLASVNAKYLECEELERLTILPCLLDAAIFDSIFSYAGQ